MDLLLLLEGEVNPTREILRSQQIKWPLSLEMEYAVSLFPVSVEKYRRSEQLFFLNSRKEGVPLL